MCETLTDGFHVSGRLAIVEINSSNSHICVPIVSQKHKPRELNHSLALQTETLLVDGGRLASRWQHRLSLYRVVLTTGETFEREPSKLHTYLELSLWANTSPTKVPVFQCHTT